MFGKTEVAQLNKLLDQLILLYRKRRSEPDYNMLDDYMEVQEKIAHLVNSKSTRSDEENRLVIGAMEKWTKTFSKLK